MPHIKRAHLVWATLAASMTGVTGLLSLLADQRPAAPAAAALDATAEATDAVDAAVAHDADAMAFTGIVIHHSGGNQGSADTIRQNHEAQGLKGLGYHFVIGNGRGAADGSIQTGERWDAQLPGAHVVGPNSLALNSTTIGICLVGNGDARPFTDAQLASLVKLVRELQDRYDIPGAAVLLHRDVAPTASPGRLFPEFGFETRLASN